MPAINYQLSPLLQQQTATSVNLPIRYNHLKLPFAQNILTYRSGPWGMMISQQMNIAGHLYEEHYFEPIEDVDVMMTTPISLLTLHCMLLGNVRANCGINLKEGKLSLHYIPAGSKHIVKLEAGEKYHCFFITPAIDFLEGFADDYAPLQTVIQALQLQAPLHQMLAIRRFSITELNKMKSTMLRGKAAMIYYNNRITDIILLYLEQLDIPVSREVFLVDLYEKEIDALIIRIDTSPEEIFSVAELALQIGISSHILETAFKLKRGITLVLYVQQQRLKMAKHLLSVTNDSIASIALSVGYADHSYFTKLFKRDTGSTPSDYKKSL
jgi:AraC-like DNA-binding protein